MRKRNKKFYSIISGLGICFIFTIIIIRILSADAKREKLLFITINDEQKEKILSYLPQKERKIKIIFLSSIKNCESCVRDHVRFLKSRFIDTETIADSSLFFCGLDAVSYDKLMRYRRVFRLKTPVFLWENTKETDDLINLSLPIFIILNDKNQIASAWASKLETFHLTVQELEKHTGK